MHTQIKKTSTTLVLAAAISALAFTACNSSDSAKTGTDSTSTTVMSTDTSTMNNTAASTANNNQMAADTTKMTGATGTTATGSAKPNPAKKGSKGKVSVAEQKMNSNTAMTEDNNGVYSSAEILPAFPGGSNSLSKFFNDNIVYPQSALDDGVESTVTVNFAVDENGKLSNAKVVGAKAGYGLDEEALRVVNKMPTWTPGRIKGKNVKTYYTLPIAFQLY